MTDVTRRQFLKHIGGAIAPAALAASGMLSVPRVAAALDEAEVAHVPIPDRNTDG